MEQKWTDLYYYPERWYDNRAEVAGTKRPDFKRKADGESLWLDSKGTPEWVTDFIGKRGEVKAWEPPPLSTEGPPF